MRVEAIDLLILHYFPKSGTITSVNTANVSRLGGFESDENKWFNWRVGCVMYTESLQSSNISFLSWNNYAHPLYPVSDLLDGMHEKYTALHYCEVALS